MRYTQRLCLVKLLHVISSKSFLQKNSTSCIKLFVTSHLSLFIILYTTVIDSFFCKRYIVVSKKIRNIQVSFFYEYKNPEENNDTVSVSNTDAIQMRFQFKYLSSWTHIRWNTKNVAQFLKKNENRNRTHFIYTTILKTILNWTQQYT